MLSLSCSLACTKHIAAEAVKHTVPYQIFFYFYALGFYDIVVNSSKKKELILNVINDIKWK